MNFRKISTIYLLPVCFLMINTNCIAQQKANKFFISAGYGLAGSFFVRSIPEFAPFPQYKTFYKKNFLGTAQNIALGINFKKNWEAKFGINYQHFTRRIETIDTLFNVRITTNHDIHHRDFIWHGNVAKRIEHEKYLVNVGLGLYYLREKDERIEIFYPNYFADTEPLFKDNKEEEGGAFVEFAYEYKFQPKVNIGVKTQFYYTLSTWSAESITLFPYVKILF